MKHAACIMIPRGKGSVVSLGSVVSIIGSLGAHNYAGSKHAMLGLTKNVAAELGKHGIHVNCVSPYAGPMKLAMPHLAEDEKMEDAVKGFLAIAHSNANLKGVDLTADDVAEAVIFLASDEAKYISGLNRTVDGGLYECQQHFEPLAQGISPYRFIIICSFASINSSIWLEGTYPLVLSIVFCSCQI